MSLIQLAERGWLPDSLIRLGMRRMLRKRLAEQSGLDDGDSDAAIDLFAQRMRRGQVAIDTDCANEQHYEVPAEFFETALGSRLKYSCGLWESAATSLDESETAMLEQTCRRAGIEDGMHILELGCGWGSLSLWIAERYPQCRLVALSNSASQRRFIEMRCRQLGIENLRVITADVGSFDTEERFDRILSVEMFEHVRNHERLFGNIRRWLHPDGNLFVHIFCHRKLAYTFETEGEQNWMGRHFFSGGMMPAEKLFHRYDRDMLVKQHWWINGQHYARSCEQWLLKLDRNRGQVERILAASSSREPARLLVQRWRMFFMACAELFAFRGGEEWGVAHYLFEPAERSERTDDKTPNSTMLEV